MGVDVDHTLARAPGQGLSLVVPAYNEAANIEQVVRLCDAFLRGHADGGEILVCDDGSRDATAAVLEALRAEVPALRVLTHRRNRGVGEALRTLYAAAAQPLVCFLPADGQIVPAQIPALLARLDALDIVVGHRAHRADPLRRRLSARMYNATLRLLFGLRVRDVDSATLYRRETLRMSELRSRGVVICAEILIRAQRRGARIGEVDIGHQPRWAGEQTGGRLGFILEAMWQLGCLWVRLGVERLLGGRR